MPDAETRAAAERLLQMAEILEPFEKTVGDTRRVCNAILSDDETPVNEELKSLAYRMVVANHMRQHAGGLSTQHFGQCREGFCGEWNVLKVELKEE